MWCAKKMAGNSWTDEETFGLLDAWGDETIQSLLEGCKRNKHVYERIAHELEENGFERTWSQCRDKIKKLKKEYKNIKDYHNETGRKRKKEWKFFEKMDEILGTKPATRPEVLVDTLAGDENEIDRACGSEEGEELEDMSEKRPVTENEEKEVDDKEAKDKNVEKNNSEGENKNKNDEKGKKEEKDMEKDKNKEKKDKKERKTARDSKLDKSLNTVVTVVTKAQKESDQMFLAFEEKRLKLDETLLMMEDRRMREDKEREERQRKEEREFQLRMMMVLQRVPVAPPTLPSYPPLPYPTQSPRYSASPYSPSSPYTSSSSHPAWSAESTDVEDKEDC